MERYICIHGHFYQPPRENPWLEGIELQDSAYPYHDWNERITAECYAGNGASRILNGDGRIVQIVNNYARMSFNFGPTLLSWMEEHTPSVYASILAADRESQHLFSGHGSALAQVYNHIILPLANRQDKETQIKWGIQDFQRRFNRMPEGMWLAETAVDLETLDILAAHGIRFTILSPYQANHVRKIGDDAWADVSGARIDPTCAYVQQLPSGRSITLFFYDAPISQGVAFEGLLIQGENLAHRLVGAFTDDRDWHQLVHIATDGETYGHHHRLGDMALAYALHYIEQQGLARITIYGEYLDNHPPTYEVAIFEASSWSCYHGIERWRSNCGCNSGMHAGWSQEWRAPLRTALDWLRDKINPRYERLARQYLKDPWQARNSYSALIQDRSPTAKTQWLDEHVLHPLSDDEQIQVFKLLELQRHALLMYTSCGWFFDELSGIETVQIIQYAGRVIQLAADTLPGTAMQCSLERGFLDRLRQAKSNIPEHSDGAIIYEKFVKPAMIDLSKVIAHYAVSSLFEAYQDTVKVYCYEVACQDCHVLEAGSLRLTIGYGRVTSQVTHESALHSFGVLHFGDHNLTGGVRVYEPEWYNTMLAEVTETFHRADLTETIRLLDKHFLELSYSLRTLFRDEQRKILKIILVSSLEKVESAFRQVYEQHAALMRFLVDLHAPLPNAFRATADFVLNTDLCHAFGKDEVDVDHIQGLLDDVRREKITLDETELGSIVHETLDRLEQELLQNPTNNTLLRKVKVFVDLASSLPFAVDFWQTQNRYYGLYQTLYPDYQRQAQHGSDVAREWVAMFDSLGDKIGFAMDVLC
jgi:alpha-amylase/alpha-mannosidase (GH57 family)